MKIIIKKSLPKGGFKIMLFSLKSWLKNAFSQNKQSRKCLSWNKPNVSNLIFKQFVLFCSCFCNEKMVEEASNQKYYWKWKKALQLPNKLISSELFSMGWVFCWFLFVSLFVFFFNIGFTLTVLLTLVSF